MVNFDLKHKKILDQKDCTIISIVSNKGGVGKTSIAIAFSVFISSHLNKLTLLLELDSSPGDFGAIFDIDNEKSLDMALKFPEKYKEFIKKIDENLAVLKGVSNPLIAEQIESKTFLNFLKHVSQEYSCIIIDTQTVINGITLDALKISTKIFIISECSLESTVRIVNLFYILNKKFLIPRSKINLIINKKKNPSFFCIGNLARIINEPIAAIINFDRKFEKSRIFMDKKNFLKSNLFYGIRSLLKTRNIV